MFSHNRMTLWPGLWRRCFGWTSVSRNKHLINAILQQINKSVTSRTCVCPKWLQGTFLAKLKKRRRKSGSMSKNSHPWMNGSRTFKRKRMLGNLSRTMRRRTWPNGRPKRCAVQASSDLLTQSLQQLRQLAAAQGESCCCCCWLIIACSHCWVKNYLNRDGLVCASLHP